VIDLRPAMNAQQWLKQGALLWAIVGALVFNVLLFMLLALLVRDPQSGGELEAAPVRVSAAPALPEPQRQPQLAVQTDTSSATQYDSVRPAISPEQVAMLNPATVPALNPVPDMHIILREFSHLPSLPTPKMSVADVETTMAFPPQVYAAAALDSPVQPLTQTPFLYPLRAKRTGIEGWVNVALLVGLEGNVEMVEVLEAEPAGVFEESVTRSIRAWRFSPAMVMGERVKTRVVTTIRFKLED